ncbi:hypothetical protein PATA110615_21635 [Paenibacillus taichungensis]
MGRAVTGVTSNKSYNILFKKMIHQKSEDQSSLFLFCRITESLQLVELLVFFR